MTGSAGLAAAGRNGVWGVTTSVKLFSTGLLVVEVVPVAADAELAGAALDELEADELDAVDELDELVLPLVVEPLVVDLLVLVLEAAGAAVVPPELLWPPDPLAPPELWPPPEVPVELFPAVVPVVPPTTPIKASTWQRTVVLFALSTDPVSMA